MKLANIARGVVFAAALVAGIAGAHRAFASDCCSAGAPCCKPGAPCCNGAHKLAQN